MRMIPVLAFLCLISGAATAAQVRVAAVHFNPVLGDIPGNTQKLLALDELAAKGGAKIIVNTEMATSGYAFFGRSDLKKIAEPIPGPTTNAFGKLAMQYGVYIAIGMPEFDPVTLQYFNAVALVGPDGAVVGTYRKRSMLIEAAYNGVATGPISVFQTPYGRLGIVICADLLYPHFARLAALAGADILLAPANVGVDPAILELRARENDVALIVANRYGKETQGQEVDAFDQDGFTIASPFAYDFSYGSISAIVSHSGASIATWSNAEDGMITGDVELPASHQFPVIRRPDLYAHLNQDTLEPYAFSQFGLPNQGSVNATVGATDMSAGPHTVTDVAVAVDRAVAAAAQRSKTLRLLVFPLGTLPTEDPMALAAVTEIAAKSGVDLVVPFDVAGLAGRPTSVLFAVDGSAVTQFRYERTHLLRGETISSGAGFMVVDRPYGRLALLQGQDLLAPESTMVMEKLGVDIVAVSADYPDPDADTLWRVRAADYLDVVIANRSGDNGVFLGGYPPSPQEMVGPTLVEFETALKEVRRKKEPRNLDTTPLLVQCKWAAC